MTAPGSSDSVLLGQILSTLKDFGERLAVVEADLKTVIRDHTKDLDDHETRLRALEAGDYVTRKEAAEAASKRSSRFWVVVAVLTTVVIGVVGPVETVIITRLLGD